MANVPGQRLDCPVAKFRLDKRTEVAIKWYLLSADTIIIIIGMYHSSKQMKILNRLYTIVTKRKRNSKLYILGAIYQMWQADREAQLQCFENRTIAYHDEYIGHGLHTVTPEQV